MSRKSKEKTAAETDSAYDSKIEAVEVETSVDLRLSFELVKAVVIGPADQILTEAFISVTDSEKVININDTNAFPEGPPLCHALMRDSQPCDPEGLWQMEEDKEDDITHLLKWKADTNLRAKNDLTPLQIAALAYDGKRMQQLLWTDVEPSAMVHKPVDNFCIQATKTTVNIPINISAIGCVLLAVNKHKRFTLPLALKIVDLLFNAGTYITNADYKIAQGLDLHTRGFIVGLHVSSKNGKHLAAYEQRIEQRRAMLEEKHHRTSSYEAPQPSSTVFVSSAQAGPLTEEIIMQEFAPYKRYFKSITVEEELALTIKFFVKPEYQNAFFEIFSCNTELPSIVKITIKNGFFTLTANHRQIASLKTALEKAGDLKADPTFLAASADNASRLMSPRTSHIILTQTQDPKNQDPNSKCSIG